MNRSHQNVESASPRESTLNIAYYRREAAFRRQITILDLDLKGLEAIVARFYGRGATRYCVVWVHVWRYRPDTGDNITVGMGKAGGGGYHKDSAALSDALEDAGFTLSYPFGGHGCGAERDALEAVARWLGIKNSVTLYAHG